MRLWSTAITSSWGGRWDLFPVIPTSHSLLLMSALNAILCHCSFDPSGAVPSSRSHNQRHQWCVLRRLLLHLFPEVYSHYRGLLLPQELWMVTWKTKLSDVFIYLKCKHNVICCCFCIDGICRYQSVSLSHVPEHSMPIYEFRWQTSRPVVKAGTVLTSCCPTGPKRQRVSKRETGSDVFPSLHPGKEGQTLVWWPKGDGSERDELNGRGDVKYERFHILMFTCHFCLFAVCPFLTSVISCCSSLSMDGRLVFLQWRCQTHNLPFF